VTDILLTTSLDTGRLHFASEEVDLGELVSQVVASMAGRVQDKSLSLEVRAPGALPAVAADGDKLRQVLVNVIDNAIKYSPDGRAIRVNVQPLEAHVRLAVKDEGPGIPRQEQKRIFGKFYRLDPQLTHGVGGTGLGLYICREILSRMNGRIWVDSEDGQGSTFFVDLPVAASALRRHDTYVPQEEAEAGLR
jgi:signal transduction histidine kinase